MYGLVGLNLRNFVFSRSDWSVGAAGLSPISFCKFVGLEIYVSRIIILRIVNAFSFLKYQIF